ncbi:MAG: phosphate transport system permease protein [Halieaceae bacterium]|jgi:phosphate transport system permease protein
MQVDTAALLVLSLGVCAFYMGRGRALSTARQLGGIRHLNSLPVYYGAQTALWCALPPLIVLAIWLVFRESLINTMVMSGLSEAVVANASASPQLTLARIANVAAGVLDAGAQDDHIVAAATSMTELHRRGNQLLILVLLALSGLGFAWGWHKVTAEQRARESVEKFMQWSLLACASLAILTTIGILLSVLFESIRFFEVVSIQEFVFGTNWSPQTAIRMDQVGSSGAFGAIPLFTGTLLISAIAMAVAVPVGLMSAIYLAEYADRKFRDVAKPLLEILAGIPTVVYGFFAALTVAPFIREMGEAAGLSVSSESALAAGGVMGIMIIPFISSLADDVITAVPQSLRDGSLAMGATRSETIRKVVIPAALPGIVGGILLAVSRAIGETMIVVMAAGLAARLTANPLESVTTVTVQMVTLLIGDQEFDSPKTLAAFALGLMLFVTTLILNVIALQVVKRYREQYE